MARLRLFASVREAAGTSHAVVPGATVGDVVDAAVERFGETFGALLPTCKIWVNGEQADRRAPVSDDDEVALLPPVSGGSS